MTDRKSIHASFRRALGPLFIALGLLLLSPAIAVGVWLSRQGTIGFDPFSRNVGIAISVSGLISVMTGISLTIRSRKVSMPNGREVTKRARSFADMMIEVIRSKGIGNYEAEAAAEVIAADARFNI